VEENFVPLKMHMLGLRQRTQNKNGWPHLQLQGNANTCSCLHRYAHQSPANHGEVRPRSIWAVQSSHRPRGPRGCHQQEAVAGNHQGASSSFIHHISGFHSEDTV